jgi:hypothetical protein
MSPANDNELKEPASDVPIKQQRRTRHPRQKSRTRRSRSWNPPTTTPPPKHCRPPAPNKPLNCARSACLPFKKSVTSNSFDMRDAILQMWKSQDLAGYLCSEAGAALHGSRRSSSPPGFGIR